MKITEETKRLPVIGAPATTAARVRLKKYESRLVRELKPSSGRMANANIYA